MGRRIASALAAASVAIGSCARDVPLARPDLDRLRAGPALPILYRVSPSPSVDCPGDEGEKTWSGSDRAGRDRPPPLAVLARHDDPARTAGSTWEDFQEQNTRSLRRSPPLDPARATADGFLSLSRGAPRPLPLGESAFPVRTTERHALAGRFGPVPALVFETTRWVLVGCWTTYQPWFDVQATLLDLGSGKVLWRGTCGRLYPPGPRNEASGSELEADGKALYAQMMEERASGCADELFSSFTREDGR